MKNFVILTLFEEMFENFLETKALKKATEEKLVSVKLVDIRKFSKDKHNRVDFPPYGGGSGMVISCEPLSLAIEYSLEYLKSISTNDIKIIYMSPRGKVLNFSLSKEISEDNCNYIIICGHYEGIDERIIEEYNVFEISIGDYVLTGGELASQVLIDSVVRLIPGVLSEGSLEEESHTQKLLEYPQYTKPSVFKKREVPSVLLSR